MPEPTQVTLRYVGPDVDDGSIAVDDLLSALNGFSSAFYRLAERESVDQTQRIKVHGISQSSANIHLSILEIIHAYPGTVGTVGTTILGGVGYYGAKLADTVIAKIAGVAKAKKHIQNGNYTTDVSGNNNKVVIINGLNATLPVDRDVLELLQSGIIDTDLDKMASPLREDSINAFEIRHDGSDSPDLHLDASDKPYFARTRREKTATREVTLTGTMNTISKTNNSGTFITDSGKRVRYRFTDEDRLADLYRQFAHLGQVRVKCIAKLDENLDVISIDISEIEPIQQRIEF